jgi:hypothetical protein
MIIIKLYELAKSSQLSSIHIQMRSESCLILRQDNDGTSIVK